MTYVIAVDPGGTTGLATYELTPGGESLEQWQVQDQFEVLDTVRNLLALRSDAVLVCEDFNIGGTRDRSSNKTIELIGGLRLIARDFGAAFVLQSPSEAKSFVTDAKLRRVGWWKVGLEHSRSATRHLLLYLAKNKLIDLQRLV